MFTLDNQFINGMVAFLFLSEYIEISVDFFI